MHLTLGEIATTTNGELRGDAATVVSTVVTDSRAATDGSLFVALVAERDGHEFIDDARQHGACALLVQQSVAPTSMPHIVVPDTLAALGALGRHTRDRLADDVVIVGITGSTGKTSTKDLTAAAFATEKPTVASAASFNNEIGVPLTVLGADDHSAVVVVEMGARGRGHIAYLCGIARPTSAAITNIGVAHAELFGTIEETAKAKGELVEALPPNGLAVLNADDEMTAGLAARTRARVVRVGRDADDSDVHVAVLALDDGLRPTLRIDSPWGSGDVQLQMRGAHQAINAGMALALAVANGVSLHGALDGLAHASGSAWRMELLHVPSGLLVLNDAYNANTTSMMAALDALAATSVPGRRVAVLGGMAELGVRADSEHRKVGEHAARLDLDQIVVVGDAARPLADAARAAGARVATVADAAAALAFVHTDLEPGDAVLVKASRVAGLERLARALASGSSELPT